jgi:malonyl-CoA O-methyltransferase
MFSTYGPETLCELRSAFIDARLPGRVYSFSDMHDLGDALVAAGFSAPVMDMEKLKVSHANTQSLLQDLRRSGEVNSLEQRNRGLTGKQRFHRALDLLATGSTDGRINTTFEIVYGHAWKGPDRLKQDGDTSFAAPIKWSPRRA